MCDKKEGCNCEKNQDKESKNQDKGKVEEFETISVMGVVRNFKHFLNSYDYWRHTNGLSANLKNIFETTTSMQDKLGRICRHVKHQERNDPKSDWPEGMTTEMAGLLVYMILLMNYYEIDIAEGMKLELEKAVQQHAK